MPVEQFNPKTQPFRTQNAVLAYCLYMAGVAFLHEKSPCFVFYSPEILNKFNNGSGQPMYKGWELDKAVEHAHKTGRRGHVQYVFKADEKLPMLLEAYKFQVEQLEKADGHACDVVASLAKQFAEGKLDYHVFQLRLACVYLKMRIPFMEMWQKQVPMVMIPKSGQVKRSKERMLVKGQMVEADRIDHPGYIIVSLNASEATKKKLGL